MNSLLYDIPDCLLKKLQKVQHNAARLIVRPKKSSHITPILKDLHWLPIKSRVQYKILLLVFKCLRGQGPAYLTSLLEEYHPARSLRSSCQSLLTKPKTKRKYGDRAFSVAGPTLWNDLPDHLRNSNYSLDVFKKALKTHLFDEYYGKKGDFYGLNLLVYHAVRRDFLILCFVLGFFLSFFYCVVLVDLKHILVFCDGCFICFM